MITYFLIQRIIPSDTVIYMTLPDSVFLFTVEVNALEQIKDSLASKYFYRFTFVSVGFTIYQVGTSFDWNGDTKLPF